MKRYGFDKAILIFQEEPGLLMRAIVFGCIAAVPLTMFLGIPVELFSRRGASEPVILTIYAFCALVLGYWRFHSQRETIYVKDLIHGRYFSCDSVVDLARTEAWLETVVAYLRQVMETAKHWDGTQRHVVEALPKDEARQVILRGL